MRDLSENGKNLRPENSEKVRTKSGIARVSESSFIY